MSKQTAVLLSILMIASVGAMSTAVGGVIVESSTVTDVESQAMSVTKTVSINTTVGSQGDDRFKAIESTSDGGYIAAGKFNSGPGGDMWVVKFDSNGNVVWNKTYTVRGQENGFIIPKDGAFDILETNSGYLVAGQNADSAGLIKIDDQGNEQWNKSYSEAKKLRSVVETSNGDYVAAGVADSSQGDTQAFLIRVNSQGVKQWSQTYGGVGSVFSDSDNAKQVVATGDGGFVFVGSSQTYGASDSDNNVWVVKTNGQGVEQWNRTLGDSGDSEEGRAVVAAQNGGYVILGDQQPKFLAYKLSEQGSLQWQKTYLGSDLSVHSGKSYLATDITRTSNGNYLLIGEEVFTDFNTVAVKIASDGTAQWNTSFPDNLGANFSSTKFLDVKQTSDGDFVFGGYSADFGPGTKAGMIMKIGFSTGDTTQNQPPTVSLSANTTTVRPGETISFSTSASDPNGDSLSYSWDFGDGSTASGTSTAHAYSSAGNYTVTVTVTDGQGGSDTATQTVTVEPAETGTGGGVTASFGTSSISVSPGGSTTVDLQANNIDNGVKSYSYTVTVSNTSVATITGVELVGANPGGVATNLTITDNNATAIVSVAQGDDNNGVFSTLTLAGQNPGTADLTIEQVTLGDNDFSSYNITGTTNATIEVSESAAPPAVVGNNRPTDPDGDGKFDDVTGDGRTNILDVGALLKNRNSPNIQNNADKFDFTGDGRVNILDVGKLLQQVL